MSPVAATVVIGEVLWDVFPATRRLGGAPLNFAAQLRHLGHPVTLISGLGDDEPGREAARQIAALDLATDAVQTSARWPTGTAEVGLAPDGSPTFTIVRPAAYDALELGEAALGRLRAAAPDWVYFGSLFAAMPSGREQLLRLLTALPGARRFLDLNLRPGSDQPALALELLAAASAVKLSEDELARVQAWTGLPADPRDFCREGAARFGWQAVAVTFGERGSAVLAGGDYVEAPAVPIDVADTVGAGDAYAAAFVHGLTLGWPARDLARFANRFAGAVAGRAGSLPVPARGP